jgi:hypothetical protein
MLRNHSIIVIIFSLIDFKKRLSRRDTDKRFHLSTTQDEVKISIKSSMIIEMGELWIYWWVDVYSRVEVCTTLLLGEASKKQFWVANHF